MLACVPQSTDLADIIIIWCAEMTVPITADFFFFLINIISKKVNAVGIINKEERPHLSMKDGL